jgi:RNA polymerase sigma-70 factor, ECF subfamily
MLLMLLVERRDLLARFKEGERRALEEVYRHYVADVANFLRRGFSFTSRERTFRFSGYTQPFDLDNAVQETFVRGFKDSARLGYDGLHSYKNYLLAIARNLVVDEFRNREVAMSPFVYQEAGAQARIEAPQVHDGDDASPMQPMPASDSSQISAEQEFLRRELAQLYVAFFERLDERDRIFFRARFEEQKTQVEAGETCGLSHMQARTLEKKLRERFLKFMQTNGYLDAYAGATARGALKAV